MSTGIQHGCLSEKQHMCTMVTSAGATPNPNASACVRPETEQCATSDRCELSAVCGLVLVVPCHAKLAVDPAFFSFE